MVETKTDITLTLESLDFIHWIPDLITIKQYEAML